MFSRFLLQHRSPPRAIKQSSMLGTSIVIIAHVTSLQYFATPRRSTPCRRPPPICARHVPRINKVCISGDVKRGMGTVCADKMQSTPAQMGLREGRFLIAAAGHLFAVAQIKAAFLICIFLRRQPLLSIHFRTRYFPTFRTVEAQILMSDFSWPQKKNHQLVGRRFGRCLSSTCHFHTMKTCFFYVFRLFFCLSYSTVSYSYANSLSFLCFSAALPSPIACLRTWEAGGLSFPTLPRCSVPP